MSSTIASAFTTQATLWKRIDRLGDRAETAGACWLSCDSPGPGELIVFGYDGSLDLNAGLSWGYQLTGHQGITYKELNASINYTLRLKASVNFAYKLAGSFEISACSGSKPGWVLSHSQKIQEP